MTSQQSKGHTNVPTASSVLQKFSEFNMLIDQTREKRSRVLRDIEEIQQQLDDLRQRKQATESSITRVQQEATSLSEESKQAKLKRDAMKLECSQAQMEREFAQKESSRLLTWIASYRHQFLQETQDYRQQTKRLRMKASALGLEYAASGALILSKGQGIMENSIDETPTLTDNDRSENPEDWSLPNEELRQLFRIYKERKEKFDDAQSKLDQSISRRDAIVADSLVQSQKKEQLQAQLRRIQKDITELDSQRNQLTESIEETTGLIENFNTNIKEKKNRSASVTTSTYNPYFNDKRPDSLTSLPSKKRRAQVKHIALPDATRARRTRRDRQFGTSLQIGGEQPVVQLEEQEHHGFDDDDDDEALNYVAFSKK